MDPKLQPGARAVVEFTVTPEMAPHFDGIRMHAVCATWTLVQYFETAGRRVLEPHLEPHEQGMGAAARIDHRTPAALGARVRVEAVAEEVSVRRLVCRIAAYVGDRLVAEGETAQVILPKEEIRRRWEPLGVTF